MTDSLHSAVAQAAGGLLHLDRFRAVPGIFPLLKRLYDRLMELAGHRHALWWLAAVSFIESSVFPIPPDVMLIPMVLATPKRAWRLALVATIASVAGGWLGYGIGATLYEAFGQKVIAFYHLEDAFANFQAKFQEYGGWIVLAKGATPIPFKLVTIASGVVHLDPLIFTVSAIGSRAFRFFLVTALLRWFGEPIREFVEKRLVLFTTLFLVVLVGGFVVIRWL
jgi:membrane protein YqaA with SNARE-associated domain